MFDGGLSVAAAVRPYRSAGIVTQVATEAWQVSAYHRLRRRVFVNEQGLFQGSDEDAEDPIALPIVAMSWAHGMPDQVVGTVRIFRRREDPETTWYGGRLAVEAAYRRHGIVGESLIRAAVCTAHALGCQTFLATVQQPVIRYFERHHFSVVETLTLCGIPHALMQAELAAYPARHFGQQPNVLWADCAAKVAA